MTVISVPVRLRVAAVSLLLCIPLIAIEVILVSRAPGWGAPYRQVFYWSMAFAMIVIPLVSWIMAFKRIVWLLAFFLGTMWVVASAAMALRMSFPLLGFFTVGLLALLSAQLYWIRVEMRRSFIDPQLAWYQGVPSPIPGLTCVIGESDQELKLTVSRMDQDGAFAFCKDHQELQKEKTLEQLLRQKMLKVRFEFNSRKISCISRPILLVERGVGLGLQFVGMEPDLEKDVGDFVELLRGGGYV